MRRLLALLLVAAATGCGSKTAPSSVLLYVEGGDMSNFGQAVRVFRADVAVTDATVTVNGTTLPSVSPGVYYAELPAILNTGDSLTLVVRAGSDVVTGIATVPALPVIVTPETDAAVHPGTPLGFSWTAAANPSEFLAELAYTVGASGTDQRTTVGGSERAASVATAAIPLTATNLFARVFSYNNGTFTGPADPASKMHVRRDANKVNLVLVQ
jgi:hypothetical protein